MLPTFLQKPLAFFIAPEKAPFWGVIENIFFTAFMMLLGSYTRNEDPLFLLGFRWTFLLPIIFALRYGSIIGAFSVLNLFLSWHIFKWLGYYPALEFPQGPFIGGLVVTMIAGEFSDFWHGRLAKSESEAAYILEKLESLTKRHIMLRLSHDRLEENLLIKPYTVKEALLKLREVAVQSNDKVLPGALVLLDLLADYCQIKRAAIYPVDQGVVRPQPVATLGETKALPEADELVQYSLNFERLAHIQMERSKAGAYLGPYLVCAPIIDSQGKMQGMLAVEQLPFLSINYENLQLLLVLLGLYADLIDNREAVREVKAKWPSMSQMFAQELLALKELQKKANIETGLVIFQSDGSEVAEQVLEAIVSRRRSLDLYWWVEQTPSLLVMMLPMTGEASVAELELFWREELNSAFAVQSLREMNIKFAKRQLNSKPIAEQVQALLGAVDEQ